MRRPFQLALLALGMLSSPAAMAADLSLEDGKTVPVPAAPVSKPSPLSQTASDEIVQAIIREMIQDDEVVLIWT